MKQHNSAATRIAILLSGCLSLGCGDSNGGLDASADYLIEARKAIASGDSAEALEALDQSIGSKPSSWAYFERARLRLEQGDEAGAKSDCQAGLELDPENKDFQWLQQEMEKPSDKRFKGRNKLPPSYAK